MSNDTTVGERAHRGRKPLNPEARPFVPRKTTENPKSNAEKECQRVSRNPPAEIRTISSRVSKKPERLGYFVLKRTNVFAAL